MKGFQVEKRLLEAETEEDEKSLFFSTPIVSLTFFSFGKRFSIFLKISTHFHICLSLSHKGLNLKVFCVICVSV